jgi:hypothetical protein
MGTGTGGRNLEDLEPLMLPLAAGVEAVLVTLLRMSSSRTSRHRWEARQQGDNPVVLLDLQDGPLAVLRLCLAARPDPESEKPITAVWVTGQYAGKPSRFDGMLERWRARREACALRDEVLAVLRELPALPETAPGAARRASERQLVTAAARLYVGSRVWRAEVLNVSERGLSVVAAAQPSAVESDMRFLLAAAEGELELLLQSELNRARVLFRYAIPGRGGVRLGLQVLTPEAMKPLLRQALTQHRSGALVPPSIIGA